MKITWAQNPLRSVVELDDADLWWLREAMEMDRDDDASPSWMNKLHDAYVEALRDVHVGDCTCVPCSCLKCWAESYLGIDTMPGLGKSLAYKVDAAFGDTDERTIDEAIKWLANYDPKPTSPMWDGKEKLWESCLPRWRDEARQACAWLVAYRDRLLSDGTKEAE